MDTITALAFGEIVFDAYELKKFPGGTPVNIAVALKNLGINTAIFGKVGRDSLGKELINFLKEKDINTDYIQIGGEETSVNRVKFDKFKNINFTIPDKASWDAIDFPESISIPEVKYLICSTLAYRSEQNRLTLKRLMEVTTSNLVVDLNIRSPYYTLVHLNELLTKAKIVCIKQSELVLIKRLLNIDQKTERSDLKALILKFPNIESILLIKRMDSVVYYSNEDYITVRRKPYDVLDPVGAGSGFLAGYIGALEEGLDVTNRLAFASAIRDIIVSSEGPNTFFTKEEVNRHL